MDELNKRNKGGRPKLSDDKIKKHQLKLLFTDDQKIKLEQKGIYDAVSIVNLIFKNENNNKEVRSNKINLNYILELNRIGNNLNQITKKLNSIKDLSSLDIEKLNNILTLINQKLSNDS